MTRLGDPEDPNSYASFGAPYNGSFNNLTGLTRDQAIRGITINAAEFLRADKYIGTIEVNKFADMIVLEKDYFTQPEDELARNSVLLTMVGGTVVYIKDEYDFGVIPKFNNNGTIIARSALEVDTKRAVPSGPFQHYINDRRAARGHAVHAMDKRGGCGHLH